jgi:hypothetical protein
VRGTFMRRFRLGLATLVSGVVLIGLAGCENEATAAPGHDSKWPASAAGIACQLLEYDEVAGKLGTTFDTAGGAKQGDTLTCALTQKDRNSPYLTLALTPTTIDSVVFSQGVKPQGAYSMPDLGVIAFRNTIAATADAGPALELVWLSDSGRLVVLKYGFELSSGADAVDALTPKLLALAQDVEKGLPD